MKKTEKKLKEIKKMKNKPKIYCEKSRLERIKECYKKNSMGDYFFRFLIKLNREKNEKIKKSKN